MPVYRRQSTPVHGGGVSWRYDNRAARALLHHYFQGIPLIRHTQTHKTCFQAHTHTHSHTCSALHTSDDNPGITLYPLFHLLPSFAPVLSELPQCCYLEDSYWYAHMHAHIQTTISGPNLWGGCYFIPSGYVEGCSYKSKGMKWMNVNSFSHRSPCTVWRVVLRRLCGRMWSRVCVCVHALIQRDFGTVLSVRVTERQPVSIPGSS